VDDLVEFDVGDFGTGTDKVEGGLSELAGWGGGWMIEVSVPGCEKHGMTERK
jgi:hypothetical protein